MRAAFSPRRNCYRFLTGSTGFRNQSLIAFFHSVDALIHYTTTSPDVPMCTTPDDKMSTSLTAITNSNTFGEWKDRTNQIITALTGVVTIGDSETNSGNVFIAGNVTSAGTLYINTIEATPSNTSNLINLNADLNITGILQVNSSTASEIKLYRAGLPTMDSRHKWQSHSV